MSDNKKTIEMVEGMIRSMETSVEEGKQLVKQLAEQEEFEKQRKVFLNRLYGSTFVGMRQVPPCGSLLGGCAPRGAFWGRTSAPHAPQSLDHLSWAEIKAINTIGATMQNFHVGDTKTVRLKNGETITLRIIGLFHDKAPDGSRIPISWEMTHFLKDRHAMNEEWTNKGGWAKSDMRKYLRDEVLPLLPDDLVQVLQTTKKYTSSGEGSDKIQVTYDKLFILSEWERYGRCFYSACQEGDWYPWYAREGVSYAKTYPDGAKGWGWSRSPYGSSNAYAFCRVNSGGGADANGASISDGVAFGLCT